MASYRASRLRRKERAHRIRAVLIGLVALERFWPRWTGQCIPAPRPLRLLYARARQVEHGKLAARGAAGADSAGEMMLMAISFELG